MIPRFPVYLFDVDGTLVDSALDITAAITQALQRTRQTEVPVEFLRTYIGRHLIDLFEHLLPEFTRADHDQLIAEYRTIYLARTPESIRVSQRLSLPSVAASQPPPPRAVRLPA